MLLTYTNTGGAPGITPSGAVVAWEENGNGPHNDVMCALPRVVDGFLIRACAVRLNNAPWNTAP